MILTTSEAAGELGLSESGVRTLVERGTLKPIIAGTKPLRFWLLDVAEARLARQSRAETERLDRLAARWVAESRSA